MGIVTLLYRKPKKMLKRILLALHRKRILKEVNSGEGLHLEGKIRLIQGNNLCLGQYVHIGANAYLNCTGGVSIGDHTILSRNVTIYSYDHNFKKSDCLPFDDQIVKKPVQIGSYVWIGMNVTIVPGTKIGNGAVIGLGSVVSGSIPENAIVVSQKTQVIGYRDKDKTQKLASAKHFYKSYWK